MLPWEEEAPPLASLKRRGLMSPDDKARLDTLILIVEIPHITFNATYDGTNWQRPDTAREAWLLRPGGSGNVGADSFLVQRAAAGANPIAWTTMFAVDGTTGRLTTPGIWEPSEFYLGIGANNVYAHGLGAKPRFVTGTWGTTSGNTPFSCAHNAGASGATVRIDSYDGANIRLVNDSGSNVYVSIKALK